jgi:uncharacterized integral membrane protein
VPAPPRPFRPRCFFTALVFAWVAAVFVPSALLALFGLAPLARSGNLLLATLDIADEVSPQAKIGFILLFAGSAYAAERLDRRGVAVSVLLACTAMLVMIALLPVSLSRGFGVGLAGTRFDPEPLAIYFLGAALAGLIFARSETRCRHRHRADHSPAQP